MKREPSEDEHEKITEAICAGDKAQAISLYISIKGCGLTEAQEFIRKLTAELKETKPEKFAGKQQKKHIVWERLIFSARK
jgi:ribosomal protein L7/L12